MRGDEEEDEEDGVAFARSLTQPELEELQSMVHSDYIYSRLVESIAPTVYGVSLPLLVAPLFILPSRT